MMFADLLLATERLKSEKRFLSNMIMKLVGENQQLLKENKHFRQEMRSLQYPQRYIKRTWEEIEVEDGMKTQKPKTIMHQQEEWSRLCDCQLARPQEHLRTSMAQHGMASCESSLISDSTRRHHLQSNVESWQPMEHRLTRNTKTTLQWWEKKMEEKKGDLFKEQVLMVETRAALIEQGKHIESLQMKINCLQEELKDSELQTTLQAGEQIKDDYAPCLYEVGMEHLESQVSRAGKRSCVYVWQTSTHIKRPEDDTEKMTEKCKSPAPEVPQQPRYNLNKKWLEESLERLQRKGDPKASRKKVLRWLEASMENLTKEISGAPKPAIEEWLKESRKNVREECPDEVKEWLDISINNLQDEGPETSHLGVREWHEESIKSLQGLQESDEMLKKEQLEGSIKEASQTSEENVLGSLHGSMEDLREEACETPKETMEESLENTEELCSEVSRKDVSELIEGPETDQEWTEESSRAAQEIQEQSQKATKAISQQELLAVPLKEKAAKHTLEASGQEWLGTGPSDLAREDSETTQIIVPEWPQAPMKVLSDEEVKEKMEQMVKESMRSVLVEGDKASRENMQKLLQASLKDLIERNPEGSSENVQDWLESSLKKIDEFYPEESRQEMKEWFKSSFRNFQDLGLEASHMGVEEWLEASLKGIQEIPEADTESIREKGPGAPSKKGAKAFAETQQKSMLNVGKWLQSNLINRIQERSETSEETVKDWIEESLNNLDDEVPETSREDVREWLEKSRKDLLEASPESSQQNLKAFLKESILSLEEDAPPSDSRSVQQWLDESIANVQKGASMLGIQNWLEQSLKTMEEEGLDASKQSLQRWLEKSMENLGDTLPAALRDDVKEWLETSRVNLQEPEASQVNAYEWLQESIQNFKEGSSKERIVNVEGWAESVIQSLKDEAANLNTQEWLAESLAYLKEDPGASQQNIKEWLEDSKALLNNVCADEARMDVDKWLREVTENFQEDGPGAFKGNLQGFIRSSMSSLKQESLAASRASSRDWIGVTRYAPNTKDSVAKIKRNVSRMRRYSIPQPTKSVLGQIAEENEGSKSTCDDDKSSGKGGKNWERETNWEGETSLEEEETSFEEEETSLEDEYLDVPEGIISRGKQFLMTLLCNIICWYREHPRILSKIIPGTILAFIIFLYIHYKYYCVISNIKPV